MVAWTAAHHPDRVDRLVLNTPGNIANKPEVMARMRDSTMAAVLDPSDETVRRRVEFLFHHKEMVTDELVNLRRRVYSRPGFVRAIAQHARAAGSRGAQGLRVGSGVGFAASRRRRCCCGPATTPPAGSTRPDLLLGWLPDALLHVIDDAGHWPQWEKASRVPRRPPHLAADREGPVLMAEIAGFAGMSHSPFATLLPPPPEGGPGARFLADAVAGPPRGGGPRPGRDRRASAPTTSTATSTT